MNGNSGFEKAQVVVCDSSDRRATSGQQATFKGWTCLRYSFVRYSV